MKLCIQAVLHDLQAQEHDTRRNWAAIGEARSSSEDDKHDRPHHISGGVDTSIHMLREKNRLVSCSIRAQLERRHWQSTPQLQPTCKRCKGTPQMFRPCWRPSGCVAAPTLARPATQSRHQASGVPSCTAGGRRGRSGRGRSRSWPTARGRPARCGGSWSSCAWTRAGWRPATASWRSW